MRSELRMIGCLAVLLAGALPVLADETVQYQLINNGKVEGGQTVIYRDGGNVEVDFQFNDRGRGPKINEQYQLDSAGVLLHTRIRGHSYLGAAVDEQFGIEQGKASWRNGIDDGSVPAPAGAFYVAMNGTPESYIALVRAALQRPNQTLPLLPSGELTVKLVKTVTVPVVGGSKPALLYAVYGLGLTPDLVWLDEDKRYIGFASDWSNLIRTGWEPALPLLKTESQSVDRNFYSELSTQARAPTASLLRIRNARVLDVDAGRLSAKQDVWIQNGKFVSADSVKALRQYDQLDANNAVLIPGLWDMHSHLFDSSAVMNIAGGVTSVRDLGNQKDQLDDLIARIGRQAIAGPHVLRAAIIDADGPFRAPTGGIVKTLDEALQHIDEVAKQGFSQIKIYSSIPPEWVAPMAARAHQRGLRVSGHVPTSMTAAEAVQAGFDEIQHINMVFLNFLASRTDDTRTPLRFTLVGERASTLDLHSQPVKDFLALLKQKNTVVDPTLGIFTAMYSHEKGKANPSIARIADHFPLTVRRSQLAPEMDINDSNREPYKRSAQALMRMVKLLHDSGVPLVAGTDDLAGFALHRELELYVEAGIPAAEVLRIATLNAARLAGLGERKGRIAPGYDADWLLIDGDPLQDISAIRKGLWVMAGGSLYNPSVLYRGLSIKPLVAKVPELTRQR